MYQNFGGSIVFLQCFSLLSA